LKILYLNQYYPPDIGAPSFRAEKFIKNLNKNNHGVTVYTSYPNRYSNIEKKLKIKKIGNLVGETVNRTKSIKISDNIFGKGISFFSFFIKTLFKILFDRNKYDFIYASSPPLSIAILAAFISKRKNIPFVCEVRDLWPESLLAIDKMKKKSNIYKLLEKFEKYVLERADLVVSVSKGFNKNIRKYYNDKILFVPNGVEEQDYKKKDITKQEFLKKFNLKKKINEDDFLITYIGNIGYAQNLSFMVKAAEEIDKNIKICIFGDGSERNKIEKLAENVNNCTVAGPFKKENIGYFYHFSDVLVVHLKDSIYFNKVIPSKIFEYLLYEKPIIYGLGDESANIIKKFKGTFNIEMENKDEFIEKVDYIYKNFKNIKDKCRKNREKVLKNYNINYLMNNLIKKLSMNYEED